jgi:hypothetical protein
MSLKNNMKGGYEYGSANANSYMLMEKALAKKGGVAFGDNFMKQLFDKSSQMTNIVPNTATNDIKGGTGLELAPFLTSLVLFGLRIGNDPKARQEILEQFNNLIPSEKKKSSKVASKSIVKTASKSASKTTSKTASKSKNTKKMMN